MAQNFQFGENISGAVGNTLNRNQQNRQFMLNLAEEMKRRAFNQKIQGLAQRVREKQLALQQDKFEHQLIQDAIANDLKRKRTEKLNQVSEAQAANLRSLAGSRDQTDGDSDPSQSALNINLSSVTRQIEDKRERLEQLGSAVSKIHDTGTIPDELLGDLLETTDPTKAIFSLTAEASKLRSDLSNLRSQQQRLNEMSGIDPSVLGDTGDDVSAGIPNIGTKRGFAELGENKMFRLPGQDGLFRKVNGKPVRVGAVPEISTREGFSELGENKKFRVPGEDGLFRKVNGQAVRIQEESSESLIAPQNRGF